MRRNSSDSAAGYSRREFLRGVGASSVAASVAGGLSAAGVLVDEAAAAEPGAPVGPGLVRISLRINGQERPRLIEPRTTCSMRLRNRLDLTGAKKVCDRATCGACTVLRDGRPIYACTALAIDVVGSEITTVEGLGTPDRLSPVQAAFVHNDAQQCGFCTPGFVVACTAMLNSHAAPSAEQVRLGLGGNLCRCGTYAGIQGAIVEAGKQNANGKGGTP